MKKLTIMMLWLVAAIIIRPILGQEQTSSPSSFEGNDVVLFGGIHAQPLNLNADGYFYGPFLDHRLFQSDDHSWTASIYATANQSWYTDNMQKYTGKGYQVGLGWIAGYYESDFSEGMDMFTGVSFGFTYSKTEGESNSILGNYNGSQEDMLICASINFNILKQINNIFPRTQVQINFQVPTIAKARASWNNVAIIDPSTYHMGFYSGLGKLSLIDLDIGRSICLSPKITGFYSYAVGNNESNDGLGGEISLHRQHQDDFFLVYYTYKLSNVNPDVFVAGFSVNFSLF